MCVGIRKAHDLSTRGLASLALVSWRHCRTENAAGAGPKSRRGAPWRGAPPPALGGLTVHMLYHAH